MKITFHGAAQTVTGSKHLISLQDGRNILLDCGMFQGMGHRTEALNRDLGFDASGINWLLLSHAHIDHSGLIPKLVKEGFKGNIICTRATAELAEILLLDSAQIQEYQSDDRDTEPLYTAEDVQQALALFRTVGFDEQINLAEDIVATFSHTGHLIGSAAIHLAITENNKITTLCFSADVGRSRHPLLQPAAPFLPAEYIILESTYGDRHHDLHINNIEKLLDHIRHTCLEKKGKLIIPAFSVGRTQEILFLLNQLELENRLPDLNYFVDSPLSMRATETLKKYTDEFNDRLQGILKIDDDPFVFKGLKYVEHAEDSKRLVDHDEPCVIISASGTADAGRVRHHIRQIASDQKNTILFAGYCGPESLGGMLLSGAREIEIFGKTMAVRADVSQLTGLSAHGDCDDLCNFIACQSPDQVRAIFLVHGERRAQEALAARLIRKNYFPVQCPAHHEEFILNRASSQTNAAAEWKEAG